MVKRFFAVLATIIMLVGSLEITVSAASYSKGTYCVTASSGVNVRKGAGTNYAIVAASSKGTQFVVSKISGSWGYSSSIKCTNGTKSGWIKLTNCKRIDNSRKTYNTVFASKKGSGYTLSQARTAKATTFYKDDFVYVWGYIHDSNNNLYSSYSAGSCNITVSIYRPDGSCAHSKTYKNSDGDWIGRKLDQVGTWKIRSKITGSLTGTTTKTITVKTKPATYYTISFDANGGIFLSDPQRVKANTEFTLSTETPTRSGYTFLGWGKKGATTPAVMPGQKLKTSANVTLYAVWKKNINPTSVSLNYRSCTLNVGNTKQLAATINPSNATDKSLYWYSSNSQVVSVSDSGKITAKAPGVATITVRTANAKTSTCTVTVRGLAITGASSFGAMIEGDVCYLTAKTYPSNSSKYTWSSSNKKIVSVNSSGKITAKAAGSAVITVKDKNGNSQKVTINVYSATKWKTGKFDLGYVAKGYTTITRNNNTKNGYVRIYTYDDRGKKTNGKIHVTIKDTNGKKIREFDATSGDKINLGKDYKKYRIYVAKKTYPDNIIGQGSDFINLAKCVYWAIYCDSNCYV